MLDLVDFYAENPIVGKTLKKCVIETTYNKDTNTYEAINNVDGMPLNINAVNSSSAESTININSHNLNATNSAISFETVSLFVDSPSTTFTYYGSGTANFDVTVNGLLDLSTTQNARLVGTNTIVQNKVIIGAPSLGWRTPPETYGLVIVNPTDRDNFAQLEFTNETTNKVTLNFNNVDDTCNAELNYGGNLYLQNVSKIKIDGGSSGQVLTTDGASNLSWTTPASSGLSASSFVFNEVPTGTVIVNEYTLAFTPVSNTVQVFLNGLLQKPTTDYTVSGTTITFINYPLPTDEILCHYIKA